MGSWSDLFGRKMPMYLPSVGGLLATIVYIVVICFEEVGVGWLCLANHNKLESLLNIQIR